MQNQRASIDGTGLVRRVQLVRVVKASLDDVWRIVTSQEEMSLWWQPAQVSAVEGGAIRVCFELGGEPFVNGTVRILQAPHVFEFTWNDADDHPGLVRFDLVETAPHEVHLNVVQFVPADQVQPAAAGWHDILDRLQAKAETDVVTASRFQELLALYE